MALRELAAIFDIQVNDQALTKMNGKISTAVDRLKTFGGAVLGGFAAKAVVDFIGGQIEMGAKLQDTADKLGVSTDALQKWQYAAKMSGVEAEGANKGLQFLNKNLGEAIGGNADAAQTFQGLGVDLKKVKDGSLTAVDILPKLAEKFEGMKTQAERTATSMKIFGKQGASLLPLLQTGAKGVNDLYKEFDALGGGLDKNFLKASAEADDQLDRMKFTMRGLISQGLAAIIPMVLKGALAITKLTVGFRTLIRETNLVKTAMIALGLVLTATSAVRMATLLDSAVRAAGGMYKFALSVITTELPLVLLAAALAFAYLVLDDLYTLMQGGDSVIGRFLDQFVGAGTAAQYAAILRQAWHELSMAFTVLGPPMMNLLKDILPYAIEGFLLVTVNIVKATLAIAELIKGVKALVSGDFSKVGDIAEGLVNGVMGQGTGFGGIAAQGGAFDKLNQAGAILNIGAGPTPTFGPGNAVGGRGDGTNGAQVQVTQEIKPTITIDGSKDPKDTADQVRLQLGKVNEDANQKALAGMARYGR